MASTLKEVAQKTKALKETPNTKAGQTASKAAKQPKQPKAAAAATGSVAAVASSAVGASGHDHANLTEDSSFSFCFISALLGLHSL